MTKAFETQGRAAAADYAELANTHVWRLTIFNLRAQPRGPLDDDRLDP